MCGIAATFAYHYAAPAVDADELLRMRDAMLPRGPDGAGIWRDEAGRVGLAHRRLSIIDLSDRAAQPMHSRDMRLSITFNGEIYNFQALRSRLERKGTEFSTTSDTEVLLELYREKGEAMLPELRGMFAFAIRDAARGALFVARDPYGIKPLYYADDGWTFRAASQVKALVASGAVSSTPDPAGIVGFFLLGSVPEPFTTRLMARSLPAGSAMWVDETGAHEPRRYFSVARTFAAASTQRHLLRDDELYEQVRHALVDSVAAHLVADVPVGLFLSAGIDSTSLAGLMRDVGVERLQTVTLAFDEYQGRHDDEAPLAETVARHYATDHVTRLLTKEEFRADVDRIFHAMDQPSIDGVNTYFVSKAAHEQGLKVVLSGLGGDELFGGYNSFLDIPRWVRRFAVPARIPFLGAAFQSLYALTAPKGSSRSPKAAGAFAYGGSWHGAWYLRRGLFLPHELRAFLPADFIAEGLRRLEWPGILRDAMEPDPGTAFGRVAALEASLYMRNQLLRDSDWAGMAHSLELRVPLVDAALLTALAPWLVAHAPAHRKRLLALSPRAPLPDEIVQRRKTGFQVPVDRWLETDPSIDRWKKIPSLTSDNTPWARRWAFVVADRFFPDSLLGAR
jgi:asparagine synthase (glutamine-hydrolysing)